MSRQFEELSKDLARGISRRKAFWRFGAGVGAAALGLIMRKPARAQIGDGAGAICNEICDNGDNCGYRNHGQCVSACVERIGGTVNGTTFFCFGVTG